MFANVNDVYNYIFGLLNKQQSGSVSGTQFSSFINAAQQQYFKKLLGLPELYTVQKREAPIEIQTTQSINDSLKPFIVSATLTKTGTGFETPPNFAALVPSGYLYVYQDDAGDTQAVPQPIDFVTVGEYWRQLNNYITFPAYEYPIATYLNGQYTVKPDGIDNINMVYYRYPTTPVWAFTVDPQTDNEIYNAANSVQLEFPNLDWQNIAHLCLKYIGIYLREEEIIKMADAMINAGQ